MSAPSKVLYGHHLFLVSSSCVSFLNLSTTLFHLFPARPLVTFSHTALSTMAGSLVFGLFLTIYCHLTLSRLYVSSGHIPNSALNTILLVVLEHLGIFLAAVVCTVASCFLRASTLSHSPGQHLLILGSRCEPVRIASILPTCVLPSPVTFAVLCAPRAVF